jgi:hypothetical protein
MRGQKTVEAVRIHQLFEIPFAENIADNYETCAGSRANSRCTFDELQDFMKPKKEKSSWKGTGVYQSNGKIALESTAVNCYKRYAGRKMPNFPA